jgi:hypothetical protein
MNTDLAYAIRQLKPILDNNILSLSGVRDRVRRALDALERVAEEPETVEVICTANPNDGGIYHCEDVDCPIHGPRNQGM